MMKSYQLFRIYKRFDYEREKNTHTAVNENRKTGKSWTFFHNRLFYTALQNDNLFSSVGLFVRKIFIFFASSFAA